MRAVPRTVFARSSATKLRLTLRESITLRKHLREIISSYTGILSLQIKTRYLLVHSFAYVVSHRFFLFNYAYLFLVSL